MARTKTAAQTLEDVVRRINAVHGPATVAEVLDVCDAVLTDVARRSGYRVRAWR